MRKISLFILFWFSVLLLHAQVSKTFSFTVASAIPDSGKAVGATCYLLNVLGVGQIDSTYGLNSIKLTIKHAYDADLVIKLKAPDGTTVLLSNQNGSSGKNYINTIFTATANSSITSGSAPFTGTFLPEGGNLGSVNNKQNADGNWSLCIEDVSPKFTGTLDSFSLVFNNSPALAPLPIPPCTSTASAINTCVDAPFICNLDGFCGSTSAVDTAYSWTELDNTFYNCKGSTIQNNSFIRFIASSTSASFNVWVYNSQNNDGIQMMFMNDVCGSGKVINYGCTHDIPVQSTPFLISASGLTVGSTYYLMFDGYAGDVCDYTVQAVSGVNLVSISLQPDSVTVCRGTEIKMHGTSGLGTTYNWSSTTVPAIANPDLALSSTTAADVVLNTGALPTNVTIDSVTLTGTAVGTCPASSTSIFHILDAPVVSQALPLTQTGLINFVVSPLTVTATGTAITYQWYVTSSNQNWGGKAIAGATSPTYTPPTDAAGTLYYYCVVSNGVCAPHSNADQVIVSFGPTCTPDTLAFVQQPTTVAQSMAMSPAVTVKVFCKANGINYIPNNYNGLVTLSAKNGCGYISQSVNAVNGLATFNNVVFTRSFQNGVSLVATAVTITTTTVSDTFSVNIPTSGGGGSKTVTKTIASNDFETPLTGKWSWTAGTGTFPTDDVTGIDCQQGNCYIRKSDNGTFTSGKSEDQNTITFSNYTNLSKYKNLTLNFKVASLSDVGCATAPSSGACKSADSGPGTDINENMIVETSVDGGASWQTLLTHKGGSNWLFPFASTPVTTLSLGAGVTYTSTENNSAFKVDITGNDQFQLRFTATDNRFSENWSMDDISLVGDTTTLLPGGTQSPLPVVSAGNDTAICKGGTAALFSTVTNSVGTVKYTWSPSTGLTNKLDSTLGNPSASKLSANQTYQLTIVDGDNCPATANPVNIILNKQPVLTSQSTPAQTVCVGSSLNTLSVVAANTESYQWYSNNTASNNGGAAIAGATTSTYTPSSAVAGTTYYYCIMGGNCSPSVTSAVSGAIIISETASPTVSVTQPTCSDANGYVAVSPVTSGFTYSSDGSSFATYTSAFKVAASGNYTIYAKNTNGCISSATTGTINAALTVPANPAVSVTQPTCADANGYVTVSPVVSGLTYSIDGTNFTTYSSAYKIAAGGTYSIYAKNTDGCISASTKGTVNAALAVPAAPTVSVAQPTCADANGYITVTPVTSGYTYSTDGTSFAIYSTPFKVAAGVSYNIYAKNSVGCISTSTTGTIGAAPAAPASPTVIITQPTCTDANGYVTISPVTSGLTYSTDGTNFATYTTPYKVAASGSFSIYSKNAIGCISTAITGTINAALVVPSAPVVSVVEPTCSDANGYITVSPITSGFSYSTDGTNFVSYTTPYKVAAGVAYTIYAKNTDGCISIATTGKIGSRLLPPTAFPLTGGGNFCVGSSGLAVGVSSSELGVIYQLLINGVNSGSAVAGTGIAISFSKQSTIGNYTVVATNSTTGCTANMTGSVAITKTSIVALSISTTVTKNTFCYGDNTTFTATSKNAGNSPTYEWMINGVTAQANTSNSFSSKTLQNNDTVICILRSTADCLVKDTVISAPIVVVVNYVPTVPAITLTGINPICPKVTTTLNDALSKGVWSSSATSIATVDQKGVVTGVANGTATIGYSVTNICGTTNKSYLITVSPKSVVASIVGDSIICKNNLSQLTDATKGGLWSSSKPSVVRIGKDGGVNALGTGVATIFYTVAGNCIADTPSHIIKVVGETPKVKYDSVRPTCLYPSTGSLSITSVQGNEAPYFGNYNGNSYSIPFTLGNLSESIYSIQITNKYDCIVDSTTIKDFLLKLQDDGNCDTLYVPTCYVPGYKNTYGQTQYFKPLGGSTMQIKTIDFKLYNRYGNLIFESHDLNNGWNGTFNGLEQPTGTYVWYLDYALVNGDGKLIERKGTCVLIR